MFEKIIDEDVKDILKEIGPEIHKFESSNVLITGASGMLASYLVYTLLYANKYLFKKPAQLYLLTRQGKEKFGIDKNIHYLQTDITQEKPKMSTVHYIVHAASKAAPKLYQENKIDTLNTNILGLYNILSLCSTKTKSVLFFSSAEIYGSVSDKPVEESYVGLTDHLNQRSCYVEGKRAGETICINYFWEKQIPVKIARIFHTFGPGLNINDGRVFSDFIKFAMGEKNIVIQGDPSLKRSLLYVADAAIMFFKILLGDKNGEVYNVGSEKNNVSVKEFANIVAQEANKMNKKKITVLLKQDKTNNYYKNAARAIRPSLRKFKKDFHYSPDTSVEEAVQKTLFYFQEIKS